MKRLDTVKSTRLAVEMLFGRRGRKMHQGLPGEVKPSILILTKSTPLVELAQPQMWALFCFCTLNKKQISYDL